MHSKQIGAETINFAKKNKINLHMSIKCCTFADGFEYNVVFYRYLT